MLSRALSSLQRKPAVFVSASGIGYYGSRGDAVLTEKEPKGEGFLSDVADVWESSCERAREAGIRTVNLRMGVVLSAQGGVVHKLYWPFFMGGGGPIASGQQYMSWLTLEDAVRGIQHVIHRADLSGPVNLCAPGSCTNAQFMQALAGAMGRPCLIPMPEPIVRTVFGEMGEETLLCEYPCPSLPSPSVDRHSHTYAPLLCHMQARNGAPLPRWRRQASSSCTQALRAQWRMP